MAMITTATTKKVLMKPSPRFTEKRLATQAPDPLPMAKINPIFQLTLS